MKAGNKTLLIVALVLIAGAIFVIESMKPDRVDVGNADIPSAVGIPDISQKEKMYERAKEISTPDGFINTEPFTIEELIGEKIVLVDFWTYSCINCQRTLPYLNSWYEKYADDGLVIVGLHTPEFDFEKDFDNVSRAVDKWGIEYPVVLDNDFSTWRSYNNRYWPRKYLIDVDGFIVYDHIGEGGYEETEMKIVELLNELKARKGESSLVADQGKPVGVQDVDFAKVQTPETYLGSARLQYITGLPSVDCFGKSCQFDRPEKVPLNSFALDGAWVIEAESAIQKSETGSIALRFSASKVNLVAEGFDGPVTAEIVLDGASLGKITIDEADLYNLIDLDGKYGEHLLEVFFSSPGVSAFAFTFG